MPTSGKSKTPWSDTYWPSFESGIAHRWNSDTPQDFSYKFLKLADLRNASTDVLQSLSPAEKLDIFSGRYDYPTVQSEWQRTSPQDAQWEGICHGWAPAAQYYDQPNPVTLTNADGVQVPFGSSDIKALLSYYVATYDDAFSTTKYIGQRCNYDLDQQPRMANQSACADLNAGTWFVLITNLLAKKQTGFVVDRERGAQVWNQPTYSYSFRSQQVASNPGAAKTMSITMRYTYSKETAPAWDAHTNYAFSETYQFTVDLDRQGNVIGGDYSSSQFDRGDFAWNVDITPFNGYFRALQTIYAASTSNSSVTARALDTATAPRVNHVTLAPAAGRITHARFASNERRSWSIPATPGKSLRLQMHWTDMERQFDTVRVYEEPRPGVKGALRAVYHGQRVEPHTLVLPKDMGAYVVFQSGRYSEGGKGFEMTYA